MAIEFTFVDLFSGIGGFKLGLGAHGGRCVGFSEIDKDAIDVYSYNHVIDKALNLGDIRLIEQLPEHDIMTAGVPCQSWSIAGKNLGFDDDRGQLWNDTIYLLSQSKPKAFIFENVKGLVDPRNKKALGYILKRIKDAGYYAQYYLINSYDYGVAQNRERVYIIGFREKECYTNFKLPDITANHYTLKDILDLDVKHYYSQPSQQSDLFGATVRERVMSLSSSNGVNDYFLFNDLRNGDTTVHSWDIYDTSEREKLICMLLLKNRRKKKYGKLDGNPLSLSHLKELDPTISQQEIDKLIEKDILKEIDYKFIIIGDDTDYDDKESVLLSESNNGVLVLDDLKSSRKLKVDRVNITETINSLVEKGSLECVEKRYDFKNTKISSGINGINRIFMPSSKLYPTLVASDTNDYIALESLPFENPVQYKQQFISDIYYNKLYRKITVKEACLLQGFPSDFSLPESRSRWMRLIGNSVSVPVIEKLGKAILDTGVIY